jgi:hypothetical protein
VKAEESAEQNNGRTPQRPRQSDFRAANSREACADRVGRAEGLILTRQRIHAGRMLPLHPGGPSDLRPEEARDAKATAEIVVRSVVDWLRAIRAGSAV